MEVNFKNPCNGCERAFSCPYIRGDLDIDDACLEKVKYLLDKGDAYIDEKLNVRRK